MPNTYSCCSFVRRSAVTWLSTFQFVKHLSVTALFQSFGHYNCTRTNLKKKRKRRYENNAYSQLKKKQVMYIAGTKAYDSCEVVGEENKR